MDSLIAPTGLALLALLVLAAGAAAWERHRRAANPKRRRDAPTKGDAAHPGAPAKAVEPLRTRAAAPAALAEGEPLATDSAPAEEPMGKPLPRFDGPAWAKTEPMSGMGTEPQFLDTMPADTTFADTMPAGLAFDERPRSA